MCGRNALDFVSNARFSACECRGATINRIYTDLFVNPAGNDSLSIGKSS